MYLTVVTWLFHAVTLATPKFGIHWDLTSQKRKDDAKADID